MPTGHYKRKKTGERITITCETCGKDFVLLKSVYRVRIKKSKVRFCSQKCMGLGMRIEGCRVETICDQCGKIFVRRHDKVNDINYCSKACSDVGRRVKGAKWRDKDQIKEYMKEYYHNNKKRIKELGRRWNKNNYEKVLEIKKRYRDNNKEKIRVINQNRRAAKIEGDLTLEEWEVILEAHDYKCANCGSEDNITMDHIVPLVKGGGHNASNVQPLCKSCNSRKHIDTVDYRPTELFKKVPMFRIKEKLFVNRYGDEIELRVVE